MGLKHAVARRVVGGVGATAALVPGIGRRAVRGLTVFLFHDVTDAPSLYQRETASSTGVEVFRSQVDWIARQFRVVHPATLLDGTVPDGAALITFDDAWAGVARAAVPELARRGLPSLLFLNMGTVDGAPDLGVVATYEASRVAPDQRLLCEPVGDASTVLRAVIDRYGADDAYLRYQGEAMNRGDLAALPQDLVALGSHLANHWRAADLTSDDLAASFRANADALAPNPNALPLFAFPFGARGRDFTDEQLVQVQALGAVRVFTAHGGQNDSSAAAVLDRLWLTDDDRAARDCWYRTHGRRVLHR